MKTLLHLFNVHNLKPNLFVWQIEIVLNLKEIFFFIFTELLFSRASFRASSLIGSGKILWTVPVV